MSTAAGLRHLATGCGQSVGAGAGQEGEFADDGWKHCVSVMVCTNRSGDAHVMGLSGNRRAIPQARRGMAMMIAPVRRGLAPAVAGFGF